LCFPSRLLSSIVPWNQRFCSFIFPLCSLPVFPLLVLRRVYFPKVSLFPPNILAGQLKLQSPDTLPPTFPSIISAPFWPKPDSLFRVMRGVATEKMIFSPCFYRTSIRERFCPFNPPSHQRPPPPQISFLQPNAFPAVSKIKGFFPPFLGVQCWQSLKF